MSSIKICKCGSLASWNSYFGGYYCHNCGLILEDGLPDGGRGGRMMDYDKLIGHLRECGTYGFKQEECRDAALAIKALRAELARVTAERDALIKRTAGECWACIRRYECNSRKGPHSRCWEFDPWLLKED